jgi:hypothetical protein
LRNLYKQIEFSRATYYRNRKILEEFDEGKVPVRKLQRPKLRKWGAAEAALVLKIRRENPNAKPAPFKRYEDMVIGERVQIDHMTVKKIVFRSSIFRYGSENRKLLLRKFILEPGVLTQRNFCNT